MTEQQQADPKMSRRAGLEAVKAGGEAFRAGKDPKDCPYQGDSIGMEFFRTRWIKGFNHAASQA